MFSFYANVQEAEVKSMKFELDAFKKRMFWQKLP